MTSWFGSGNDAAGKLKAFIKDHLGVSESASFDSQAIVDDVHPFEMDSNTRHGMDRQDTVIHVDVRPKVRPPPKPVPAPVPVSAPAPAPPPAPTPAPPRPAPAPAPALASASASASAPLPSVSLPTRDSRIYDFRQTDTRFNLNYDRVPDYTQPIQSKYRDYSRPRQDPQLSPPLKSISRRLEKQTTWDRGRDYLASMSDSDSDQSLSSHDTGAIRPSSYSSAESRAYFKTFNSEKFNEQQRTVTIGGASTSQITVNSSDRQAPEPYRHSSQARPLVIPDRTDPDDGYGSVENSSSGTASSDSSSPSNTPEQVSPGGDAGAVTKRREAFRKSTKKKVAPSVQEKLRKLCADSEASSVKEHVNREVQESATEPDIERCPRCGKEKGVPHLLHMYSAEAICMCDNSKSSASYVYGEEPSNQQISSDTLYSQNTPISVTVPVSSEANITVKPILPPLPNRTKFQSSGQENLSTSKVSFRFASANSGNHAPSAPLKADHGITVPPALRNTGYDHQATSEMHSLDSRHREWLLEQSTQFSQGPALPRQEYQIYSSPYQPIDQPVQQYANQSYDQHKAGALPACGVYQRAQNEHETDSLIDSATDQFNSESSRKLLNSQRSKHTSDYAKFMQLLEQTKQKAMVEESSQYQGQRSASPGQWSGSSGRSGSPSVQFMKSSEIYQRLKELRVGGKSSLRRSVSAPQSPVKKRHQLRGAWSEDYAILVRAPLPPAPARSPVPRDIFQELMSRPTLQLATDF